MPASLKEKIAQRKARFASGPEANIANDPELAAKVASRQERFGAVDEEDKKRGFKKFRKFNKNKGGENEEKKR